MLRAVMSRYSLLLAIAIPLCVYFFFSFSSTEYLAIDPYYHVSHANAHLTGEVMHLPHQSSLRHETADSYLLYHVFLAPFTVFFDGSNHSTLIAGHKIFHGLLLSVLFALIYFFSVYLLRQSKKLSEQNIRLLSLISVLATVAIPLVFTYRIFLERPHLLSIIVVSALLLLIVKKRYYLAAALAFLFPFFYSATFLLLLPPLLYAAAYTLYHRKLEFAAAITPLLPVVAGLGLGILARPDTAYYVHNAFVVPVLALVHRFTTTMPIGAELYSLNLLASNQFIWLVPFIGICIYAIVLLWKDKQSQIPFPVFYATVYSFALFILFVYIQRSAEYLFPILIPVIVYFFADRLIPWFKSTSTGEFSNSRTGQLFRGLAKDIREKKTFRRLTILALLYAALTVSLNLAKMHIYYNAPSDEHYVRDSALFLASNGTDGEIVVNTHWADYPEFVFYNSKDHMSLGWDPHFTSEAYPEAYLQWDTLMRATTTCADLSCVQVCTDPSCTEGPIEPYLVFKDLFEADYILVDPVMYYNSTTTKGLLTSLESDPRFERVFVTLDPHVELYQLK